VKQQYFHLLQQRSSMYSQPTSKGSPHPATAGMSRQIQRRMATRRLQRKQKFAIFLRIFLQYLKRYDPNLHARATAVIKDCFAKYRGRVPGYESFSRSTCAQLISAVQEGRSRWIRAEIFLYHFLDEGYTGAAFGEVRVEQLASGIRSRKGC